MFMHFKGIPIAYRYVILLIKLSKWELQKRSNLTGFIQLGKGTNRRVKLDIAD